MPCQPAVVHGLWCSGGIISKVPSPALHWTQPLLRHHTNCSQATLGLGHLTWTPCIFKYLKLILTHRFRLDYQMRLSFSNWQRLNLRFAWMLKNHINIPITFISNVFIFHGTYVHKTECVYLYVNVLSVCRMTLYDGLCLRHSCSLPTPTQI